MKSSAELNTLEQSTQDMDTASKGQLWFSIRDASLDTFSHAQTQMSPGEKHLILFNQYIFITIYLS